MVDGQDTGFGGTARLQSLDALRGVAALAVVFWHWQAFFFVGAWAPPGFERSAQPLYGLFFLFYNGGFLAVDLFFLLSGFVFFWLYADAVHARRVSGREFFMLRFSRLYPLHLLTLLLVALGQLWYLRATGAYFIHPYNDLRHFVLHLFMMSSVGLERGNSFNAPVWSVSVEVVVYALFYLLCRFRRPGTLLLLGIVLLGSTLLAWLYAPIGRGVTAFFLGGCVYRACVALRAHPRRLRLTRAITALAIALWALTAWLSWAGWTPTGIADEWKIQHKLPVFVLFPLTILALALQEARHEALGARLAWLGDVSYASYLWHFPLQMLFVAVLAATGVQGRAAFDSPWMLLVFFGALIALSLASYRCVERPLQRRLRRLMIRRPERRPTTPPLPPGGGDSAATAR